MFNSQNVSERIKQISKEKKILIHDMLKSCELSKNALSSMNAGSMPKVDNLGKIAEYLDVSVDYLLGRTDKPEVNK